MRPITVTVGPTGASQTATAVCSAQQPTAPGPSQLWINGTPSGGSNVAAFVGQIAITGNIATVSTTTSGVLGSGMRLSGGSLPPNLQTTGPAPGGGFYLNQAVFGVTQGAPLSVRANVVCSFDLGLARQVLVTNTEPAGNAITIQGTDASGNPISETMATNGGNLQTVANFLTVTQVYVAKPPAGNISVGGATSFAYSPWVAFDPYVDVAAITKTCAVTAPAVTYTVQFTNDDPNAPGGPSPQNVVWQPDIDAKFVGATANQGGTWAFVPTYARVQISSGSGSGMVTATFSQQGGTF